MSNWWPNCDDTVAWPQLATTSAAANVTVYPSTVAVSQPAARTRTPLDWLREQIEEITQVAIA